MIMIVIWEGEERGRGTMMMIIVEGVTIAAKMDLSSSSSNLHHQHGRHWPGASNLKVNTLLNQSEIRQLPYIIEDIKINSKCM